MENQQAPKGQYHYVPTEKQEQPEIYPIDATKAVTIQELGIIFNALGVGMTKETYGRKKNRNITNYTRTNNEVDSKGENGNTIYS